METDDGGGKLPAASYTTIVNLAGSVLNPDKIHNDKNIFTTTMLL